MVPSRPAFLGLALLALGSVAGCQYGNGSPCEIDGDCAGGECCGETATARGFCVTEGMCTIVPRDDTGTPDTPDVPVVDEDAPIDTGVDAPMDTGVDAPEDTGVDAGGDAGDDDAGGDAGSDAGTDTGVDAPT